MRRLFTVSLIFVLSSSLQARILHVPSEYPNIQSGIDAAVDGDTVLVAPGLYTGAGNYEIDFYGKAILVTSEMGPDSTVVANRAEGFIFQSGETSSSILNGFTISYFVVGVQVLESSPLIENCKIFYCGDLYMNGAALVMEYSSPVIANCEIGYNASHLSGVIYSSYSNPIITNTVIYRNVTLYDRIIGIYGGNALFLNCTISINGSGIYGNSVELRNCIYWGNYGEIFGTADINYSDIEGGWPGEGNINEDPLFVDPENDDYDLLPESPCIDAGDPDTPNIRWGGFRRDMGAFEYDQGFYFDGQNLILKPFPIRIPWLR